VRWANLAREYAITVAVAVVVFLVAYDNGGFAESTRGFLGIAIWWIIILVVAFGLTPRVRIPTGALVTGGFIAAFGFLTLLSAFWAADAAGAYLEFARVTLYLGVFVLVVIATDRRNVGRWADGIAIGLVGVTVVALVSRFFPGSFPSRGLPVFLPSGATRLAFPVGYWNGLAILVALAIPLLLRIAVREGSIVVRSLALVPVPAIAAVIYLASSRTGVATAVIGGVAFLLFTSRRWAATGALVVCSASSVAAVLALLNRDALVNGPLSSPAAASEGKSATLIIAGVCVLAGLLYGVGIRALEHTPAPSRAVGWILVAVAVVAAVVAIVAVHPIRRFDAFRSPGLEGGDIQAHILSSSGNGRWQLWASAVDEFKSKPAFGRGAGSYESWWLEHASLPLFVQDAHSLYVEVLGELGIAGFILLVGAFLAGIVTAVRRLLRLEGDERVTLAALTATFVAYAVAAAVDWMWELTIVSVVAFACLALATGPGTAVSDRPRLVPPGTRPPLRARLQRYGLGGGVVIASWLLICALAIPLLADARLQDSRTAVGRGDLRAAFSAAADARAIQPWSAEPALQLALVQEVAGNFRAAHRWILRAIARDRVDWRLWLARARIEAELGLIDQAARSLDRARSLNPKSPIFKS
jgi:O-Antigen ligase